MLLLVPQVLKEYKDLVEHKVQLVLQGHKVLLV
jgi:hypothetical protein